MWGDARPCRFSRDQRTARRVRAAIASLATLVLVATGLVVVAAPAQAAGATSGTVSGIVFQDFTSAGWYTTGSAAAGVPRNRPVAGVTVKAFDAEGDLVGTAASAADGTYTLPVSNAFSAFLRVEFSGWSGEYEPAFAAQGTAPPTTQGDNNTSVQFVTLDRRGRRRPASTSVSSFPTRSSSPMLRLRLSSNMRALRPTPGPVRPPTGRRSSRSRGRRSAAPTRPDTSPSAQNSPSSARSARPGGSRTTV